MITFINTVSQYPRRITFRTPHLYQKPWMLKPHDQPSAGQLTDCVKLYGFIEKKKKNPCVSGPVQFKPELFKSELYFKILESLPLCKSKLSITGHKDRIALSHSFIVGKK